MAASTLYAMNTANWTLDFSLAVQTRGMGEPYPAYCPAFLIEHPEGLALFDTGLSYEMVQDPEGYGAPHMAAFVDGIDIDPEDAPQARIGELGYDPGDVDYVVLSHLHTDHAGNIDAFPEAEFVVRKAELRYAGWPDGPQELFYLNGDVAPLRSPGTDVIATTGPYDVFGDGSVVTVPTPGHSPGHQALRVELASGTYVLAADTALHRTGWEEELAAAFTWSLEEAIDSIRSLKAEARRADAEVLIHHDPEDVDRLPAFPEGLE